MLLARHGGPSPPRKKPGPCVPPRGPEFESSRQKAIAFRLVRCYKHGISGAKPAGSCSGVEQRRVGRPTPRTVSHRGRISVNKKMAAATLAAVWLALGAGASFASKKEKKSSAELPAKEQYTATLSPAPKNIIATVTIIVTDYTTDAEIKDIGAAYQQGGDGALRGWFHKGMGYITTGGNGSFGFFLVRSIHNGSSRTEFMIGIAPLAPLEGYASPFDLHRLHEDYPYSLINLQLDGNGNGSGVWYQFVKLQFDAQGSPHVTPADRFPVKLIDVHQVKN